MKRPPDAMVGLGLGAQTKPCVRAVVLVTLVTLVCMVYLLGYDQQIQMIRPPILTIFTSREEKPSITETAKEGYLVWSPSCKIPDMDPRHETIKKFLKPAQSIVCSKFGSLTYISTPKDGPPYVLKVDTGIAHRYVGKQNFTCCYANVTRYDPDSKNNKTIDNKFNIGKCEKFTKEVSLSLHTEFILVKCNILRKGKDGKEIYKNMHAVVPIKANIKSKLQREHKEQKPNILLIGIDSVSRLNFIRTMPKTAAYFQRGGWIEMKGYNKIGDNTFPNLVAVLTGRSLEQVKKTCWPKSDENLDDCPYLWKEFSEQGYVTLYGEDETAMSTFNYHKPGFFFPPTDYYLRPFLLAAEKKLPVKTRDHLYICLGSTSTTEHMLKYASDFTNVFKNALYFAFLWLNNISHNNPNNLAAMDYKFHNFFNELEQSGVLNNTIVAFYSDHGMRFGKIRETVIGWYEERLPFLQLWIPKWFRIKYSEEYNSVLINKDRLTSPYDLHLTLRDILYKSIGNDIGNESLVSNGSMACPKCKSLFSEVPYNRSCKDAGITPHWCTCDQYEMLSTVDDKIQEAAKFVVSQINKKIQHVNKTQNSKKCAVLQLKRLVNVRGRKHNNSKNEDFVILIETVPGNALFEATVRYLMMNHAFEVLGIISRINMYWDQSKCINDSILKLYCYCVNS